MAGIDTLTPLRRGTSPADLDWFWAIVDGTVDDDEERQLDLLESALRALSDQDLVDFLGLYSDVWFRMYSYRLWAAAYVLNGGCSDDGFMDFRAWLISHGRAVAEKALADPDSLADIDLELDAASFEAFGYVGSNAYRARSGGGGPPSYRDGPYSKPSDPDWSFDFDDRRKMKRRLPRLAAKYL